MKGYWILSSPTQRGKKGIMTDKELRDWAARKLYYTDTGVVLSSDDWQDDNNPTRKRYLAKVDHIIPHIQRETRREERERIIKLFNKKGSNAIHELEQALKSGEESESKEEPKC